MSVDYITSIKTEKRGCDILNKYKSLFDKYSSDKDSDLYNKEIWENEWGSCTSSMSTDVGETTITTFTSKGYPNAIFNNILKELEENHIPYFFEVLADNLCCSMSGYGFLIVNWFDGKEITKVSDERLDEINKIPEEDLPVLKKLFDLNFDWL